MPQSTKERRLDGLEVVRSSEEQDDVKMRMNGIVRKRSTGCVRRGKTRKYPRVKI